MIEGASLDKTFTTALSGEGKQTNERSDVLRISLPGSVSNSSSRSGDTTPFKPALWKRAEPSEPSEPGPLSGPCS